LALAPSLVYMGHLLKIKCVDSRVNVHILASASVTFTVTTVQVLILALTHTEWITVKGCCREKEKRGVVERRNGCSREKEGM
jgi:hypothetical protein